MRLADTGEGFGASDFGGGGEIAKASEKPGGVRSD